MPASTPSDETVKVSANLPKETFELLKQLSAQRGVTMTEVLKQAIAMEAYLDGQERVIVEGADKKLLEVVRPHIRRRPAKKR